MLRPRLAVALATPLLIFGVLTQPQRFVLISNDAAIDGYGLRCLTHAAGPTHAFVDDEAYIAADPRDATKLIAVWQTHGSHGSAIQWSRSTDSGKTWTKPHTAAINACAGGPVPDAERASDPWVEFGPNHRVYASAIAWTPNPGGGPDLVSALVVAASGDAGRSWERPRAIAIASSKTIAFDNLAITADPVRNEWVYVATTHGEWPTPRTYFGQLGFARSKDGGRSWEPLRLITPRVNRERIGAPQIKVDPRSGRLYAVYTRRNSTGMVIGVMTSDNGGDDWSPEHIAAQIRQAPPTHLPTDSNAFVFADDIVHAVVLPKSGRVAIAFTEARPGIAPLRRVSVTWSADGARWAEPIPVSADSSVTAWLPQIAASPSDEVAITYLEADFAARTQAETTMRLQRTPLQMTEHGLVAGSSSELDSMPLSWPGDYQGLVSTGRGFVSVYGRAADIAAR
ncbi:MAG: sialidase family protein [Gemmatimonadaceae bacterium]